MKKSEIAFGLLKIPADIIAIMFAAILAYKARTILEPIPGYKFPFDIGTFQPLPEYIEMNAIFAVILIIIFAVNKMYSLKLTTSIWQEFSKVFLSASIWLMGIIAYFFMMRQFPFSRLVLGYNWIFTILFVFALRLIIKIVQIILLKFNIGKTRIIVLGNSKIADYISSSIELKKEYKLLGKSDFDSVSELEKYIKQQKPDEIIQTKSSLKDNDVLQICRENHIIYRFIPDLIEAQQINLDINEIGHFPVITLKPTPLDGWGKVVKRIFDVIGSLLMMIVLLPIMFLTAIAVKFTSKGPILFCKKDDGSPVYRVGQFKEIFRFYKFRTMKPNTDNLRYTILAERNTRKGPLVKIKNDPRLTSIGSFLRKTNIDELPQLWSVFKGEMSLVGPRPHLPEEVDKYDKKHNFVFTIKPGITGISQIEGRSDLDFETEMKLDTYYIQNWSLWLDIKILFGTLGTFFKGYQE